MASTARSDEDKKEFFDPPEVLEAKAAQMVELIKGSKHFIAFTGAGISTSAGIRDFRSGMDTKLETGPGVWELRAHGKQRSTATKATATTKAIPTATHMMFVKLIEEGLLRAVISQNCDGLHRRSGLPVKDLFELHGNSNVERCSKCKRRYLRDFRVRTATSVKQHKTGRKCDDPKCRGDLADTIINFGESLPQKTLDKSFKHAENADLCLAMGSSLTVTPAADIPETVGEKQKLVIVNLQRTPLDHLAEIRVFAKCDDFSKLVMAKLGLEIPDFRLKRRLFVKTQVSGLQAKVMLEQVDIEGNPFSFLKGVDFSGLVSKRCDSTKDLLECSFAKQRVGRLNIQLYFQGHYDEPPVFLPINITGRDAAVDVRISFDPFKKEWDLWRSDGAADGLADKLKDCKLNST